jgi:hypothetical protein
VVGYAGGALSGHVLQCLLQVMLRGRSLRATRAGLHTNAIEAIQLANHVDPLQRPLSALRVRVRQIQEVTSYMRPAKSQDYARIQSGKALIARVAIATDDALITRVRQLNPFSSFFGPLALIKSST